MRRVRRRMLEAEEEHVKQLVQDVLRVRPDLVVTEKGVSDLAIHYLQRANVSCLRRLRKTDNLRLARYARLLVRFACAHVAIASGS